MTMAVLEARRAPRLGPRGSAQVDLPLKVLVWEDGKGAVAVSYNAPEFLAERHHIEGACVRPSKPASGAASITAAPTVGFPNMTSFESSICTPTRSAVPL